MRDVLHSRMIELEELTDDGCKGADPLSDEEMIKIFDHPMVSSNSPEGLLRRVFLWIGCCTARRGGSYLGIKTGHLKERDDGGFNLITIHDKTHQGGYYHKNNNNSSNKYPTNIIPPDETDSVGACHDIKKYMSLRPENAEEHFFLRVNKNPTGIFFLIF